MSSASFVIDIMECARPVSKWFKKAAMRKCGRTVAVDPQNWRMASLASAGIQATYAVCGATVDPEYGPAIRVVRYGLTEHHMRIIRHLEYGGFRVAAMTDENVQLWFGQRSYWNEREATEYCGLLRLSDVPLWDIHIEHQDPQTRQWKRW